MTTQSLGKFQGRAYQTQTPAVDVGTLLPVRVGRITFALDVLDGAESFDEYVATLSNTLELINLLELTEDDYDNIEWNNVDGYDLYSDHPVVLAEFSEICDGEDASNLEDFFTESVVQEVKDHPRRYPKIDPYALAQDLAPQYYLKFDPQSGTGTWVKKDAVEGQEPRAQADLNAAGNTPDPWNDAEDGSDY